MKCDMQHFICVGIIWLTAFIAYKGPCGVDLPLFLKVVFIPILGDKHKFLHSGQNWRRKYFNCSGISIEMRDPQIFLIFMKFTDILWIVTSRKRNNLQKYEKVDCGVSLFSFKDFKSKSCHQFRLPMFFSRG